MGITQAAPDSLLHEIEDRIDVALGNSLRTEVDELAPLLAELEAAHAQHSEPIVAYWLAYGLYAQAVLRDSKEQEAMGAQSIDRLIAVLEGLKKLDAEAHVMLGSAYSYSISFHPGEAVVRSSKADKHYNKALKIAPDNLRAHLCKGKSDYYTPEEYGGGKEVEALLLKALTLPEQTADYPHAPSWGKDEAYLYLALYYHREDRYEEALLYCKQGLAKYPDHSRLKSLVATLN